MRTYSVQWLPGEVRFFIDDGPDQRFPRAALLRLSVSPARA